MRPSSHRPPASLLPPIDALLLQLNKPATAQKMPVTELLRDEACEVWKVSSSSLQAMASFAAIRLCSSLSACTRWLLSRLAGAAKECLPPHTLPV